MLDGRELGRDHLDVVLLHCLTSASWTKEMLDSYFAEHDLPRHPLEAQGYPSIGCSPCTSKVAPGEDPRSGRWKGWDKTECGIHSEVTPLPDAQDDNGANDPVF